MSKRLLSFFLCTTIILFTGLMPATAEEIRVAVAANFRAPLEELAITFEGQSEHRVTVVTGSTGMLYTQILYGAPYDLFFAADQRRPQLLEAQGKVLENGRITYAVGKLSLWSFNPHTFENDGFETLRQAKFRRLAIANPDLAPYGVAAKEVLDNLELSDVLEPKIVMGENVGQAFALVASRNAEIGIIARSSTMDGLAQTGSRWDIPDTYYSPILQDAVILKRTNSRPAARAFFDFLSSPSGRAIIEKYGYGTR